MHKATLYETNNSMQQLDTAKLLSQYIDQFSWGPNELVLDVGCGPGNVTVKLLLVNLPSSVIKLVGMDVSPNMIKHATNNYTNPKLEFVVSNIADQNLETVFQTKFSKIFSFYCLHWVQDQRQAFSNMFNLLSPGGEVLLLLNASNPIYELYEKISTRDKWAKYTQDVARFVSPYHHSKHPISEMNSLLHQVGFNIIQCYINTSSFSYRNLSDLRQALLSVNPFLERIPDGLQDEFLDDLVDTVLNGNLREVFPKENNTVSFNYTQIIVFAAKKK
uniref:Juvenile hormone acid O-methyltransferase n=1 Tax=Cacopsylla melanoneura TaxID=428564 RepID=A0A8D8SUL3_9HEMI